MQNKGLIKLFALLFGLVSIYQLSFTFKANQIEKEAKQFATSTYPDDSNQATTAELRYLDSLNNQEVYNMLGLKQFTYTEV